MSPSAPAVGHPYPTDFPLAELRRLIAFLRGGADGDARRAAHDAYHVLGYVLGTLVGEPGPLPIGTLFDNVAADELEAAVITRDPGALVQVAADVIGRVLRTAR